ncbi:MAG: hypothetical protein IK147_01320 [Clostridia bacterium]|nr:hypothetical protein [Clostridia bacterium]
MKKFLSFVLLLVVVLGLVACGNESSSKNDSTQDSDYITLNMSNCNYYLSIDENTTAFGSTGNISWRAKKVTINGAVSGIYSDCVLTFEYISIGGKEQKTVQLNVAGFASFEYTTTESGNAKIVSCTGGNIFIK